jgi:hypothetical protein
MVLENEVLMRVYGLMREEVQLAVFSPSLYSFSSSTNNKTNLILFCTNYYSVPSEGTGVDRSAKFNLNSFRTYRDETYGHICRILEMLPFFARCVEDT